eukprot:scpid29545/ scgid27329/ 
MGSWLLVSAQVLIGLDSIVFDFRSVQISCTLKENDCLEGIIVVGLDGSGYMSISTRHSTGPHICIHQQKEQHCMLGLYCGTSLYPSAQHSLPCDYGHSYHIYYY